MSAASRAAGGGKHGVTGGVAKDVGVAAGGDGHIKTVRIAERERRHCPTECVN